MLEKAPSFPDKLLIQIIMNVAKTFKSIVMGTLRIALFFTCLMCLAGQVLYLVAMYIGEHQLSAYKKFQIGQSSSSATDYLIYVALAAIAFTGMIAAFYKHPRGLKLFAILAACSSMMILVFVATTVATEGIQNSFELNKEIMSSRMSLYDWTHKSTNWQRVEATRTWDSTQFLYCCGMKSYRDWDEFRPANISDHLYPSSCCLHLDRPTSVRTRQLCDLRKAGLEGMIHIGCEEQLQVLLQAKLVSVVAYFMLQTLLAIIATILYFSARKVSPRSRLQQSKNRDADGEADVKYKLFSASRESLAAKESLA